jgi:hypothetical protein
MIPQSGEEGVHSCVGIESIQNEVRGQIADSPCCQVLPLQSNL